VVSPIESDLMSLDLASLKPLILPEVPGVDEFFDINITLAASPSNFTVKKSEFGWNMSFYSNLLLLLGSAI